MSTLRAQHLGKGYRSRQVVTDVSVDVTSGEIVGLLGPNGAGKTTSFYMVVGLVPCDQGNIQLDDQDLTQMSMHSRASAGLGYLPQEPSIFRKLTVAENILAVLETRSGTTRRQREERCDTLLHELHVGHLRDQAGVSLSGGERRRVEIARALAAEPRFMLLDEPFAGVDPISVVDIQQIIKQLCEQDIGILITDHNVRETLGICHRAYIMDSGKVIAEGPPQAILDNKQVQECYLGKQFRL